MIQSPPSPRRCPPPPAPGPGPTAPLLGITSALAGTKELPIPHPGPGHGGPGRPLLLLPQVTVTHSPKTSLLPQHVPLNPHPTPGTLFCHLGWGVGQSCPWNSTFFFLKCWRAR